MPQDKNPIQFPRRVISVYAQIIGPKAQCTIKMALDTGATFTMIPPEKVLVAGYKLPISEKKMIRFFTASGIEYAPILSISSLKCLGITVNNIDVVCHSLPSESPVEGLLGINFLIHFPPFIEFYQKIHPYI